MHGGQHINGGSDQERQNGENPFRHHIGVSTVKSYFLIVRHLVFLLFVWQSDLISPPRWQIHPSQSPWPNPRDHYP